MKIYYWRGVKNFGDLLAPLLLKRFAHVSADWAAQKEADAVIVGSILDLMPADYGGVIAGCGKLHEETKIDFPHAKILGLRGPLTAKGVKGSFALGDPGLLADEMVGYKDKEYNLGIIPHWTDKTLEFDPRFKNFNPRIIRVGDDPMHFIEEVAKCKKIVSSALHGIILADAFGIPRRIEISPKAISHPKQEGGLFKWRDYSESIGMKLEIGLTQEVNHNKITERQHEIYDVLEEIGSLFRSGVPSQA
jgi:pyruvyltransferase